MLSWRTLFVSSRNWSLRIQDILDAIEAIQQRIQNMSFEDFTANDVVVESVLYKFIVIGEASANIPESIKALAPELPWRQMNDMQQHHGSRIFSSEI